MGRRNAISNSSGKTKTDSCCGGKRKSETSYHGRMLKIADEAERLIASRNAANEGHDDGEQEDDQEVERDE